MRIAVHAKVLSERQLNGLGVYAFNLLKAISKIDQKNQYVLYSNEPIVQKITADNFQEKILNFPKLWSYVRFPFEFVGDKYDLLFVPKEMVPPVKRPKTVVTCHGFGQRGVHEDRLPLSAKANIWIAANYALKSADKIIVVSESVKKDIVENCGIAPDKISVTLLGYDDSLYKPCSDENAIDAVKRRYGIKNKYIINTSSLLWHRKNIVRLVKAFHICKAKGISGHQMVITGKKGEAYQEIIELIGALGLGHDVLLTDYIPTEDMPVLLSGADAMVFPSLHEGFGLSVLEAMACGCPVITSNVFSMPEVAGDAGILVDPYDEKQIASAMEKILCDQQRKNKMRIDSIERAKFFSWEKTARETLRAFESVR